MDETKSRWFRWIGASSPHFFWGLWGTGLGGFLVVVMHGSGVLKLLNDYGAAITALFTVILGLSTIGLYVATQKLWLAAEQQIDLARDAAKTANTAARASETSATAAQEAVTHARETAQKQLRAYVTITKHRILDYRLVENHDLIPCVLIKNRGQTPALNVTVTIKAYVVPPEEVDDHPLEVDPSGEFTLAPGERTSMTADLPTLDAGLVAEIQNGAITILLQCQVDYEDVFGAKHRTRMRASLNNKAAVGIDGTMDLEWHGSDNDMT